MEEYKVDRNTYLKYAIQDLGEVAWHLKDAGLDNLESQVRRIKEEVEDLIDWSKV